MTRPPEEDSTYVQKDRSSYHTFTCDDLGEQEVTIHAWDETGNVDFCEVTLLIQAGSEAYISNQIATTTDESNMGKDLMNGVREKICSDLEGL